MRKYNLLLSVFILAIGFTFAQTPALPTGKFQFTPPKSAKDAKNGNELKAKSLKLDSEEEDDPSPRVVRRVGVVSNIPQGGGGSKMGGTQTPGYNPSLRQAAEKQPKKEAPVLKAVKPIGETETTPTPRMKVAPSQK